MTNKKYVTAIVVLSGLVVLTLVFVYVNVVRRPNPPSVPVLGERHEQGSRARDEQPPASSTEQPALHPDWHILPPPPDTTLHPARVGGKVGFIDNDGAMVIPAKFAGGRPFADLYGPAKDQSGKWGMIDRAGQWVSPPAATRPADFADGLAPQFGQGKGGRFCGYVDMWGQPVIPASFEDCRPFRDELAAARKDGKWGFVDTGGNWFIPPRYPFARDYREAKAAVWVSEAKPGQPPGPPLMGFIDRVGKMIVQPKYAVRPGESRFSDFHQNRSAVKLEGDKWGYIDRQGQMVIAPGFEAARPFSDGLAAVELAGKWGFIDEVGRMVIAPTFAAADPQDSVDPQADGGEEDYRSGFHSGLAAVGVSGGAGPAEWVRWGFIDKTGKLVIGPTYKQVHSFRGPLAEVIPGDAPPGASPGYIDQAGKVVFKPGQ